MARRSCLCPCSGRPIVDGWFPMGERGTRLIEWFSPDPRGVLPLTAFHVPARLGRTLRAGRFEIRVDTAFAAVMEHCAERDDTWISDVIRETYQALHAEGDAHSVECWRDGRLVGGLYGVALGGAFFGESMFHVETDASKVALAALVERLRGPRLLAARSAVGDAAPGAVRRHRDPARPVPAAAAAGAGAPVLVRLSAATRAARAAIVPGHRHDLRPHPSGATDALGQERLRRGAPALRQPAVARPGRGAERHRGGGVLADGERDLLLQRRARRRVRPRPSDQADAADRGRRRSRRSSAWPGAACWRPAAIALSWFQLPPAVLAVLGAYVVNNVLYNARVKTVAIADVISIATGFVLRLVAGAIAIGVVASSWLLVCSFSLALFLGFGKRRSELALAEQGRVYRPVLRAYTRVDARFGDEHLGDADADVLHALHDRAGDARDARHRQPDLHGAAGLLRDVPLHLQGPGRARRVAGGAAAVATA